MEIWQIVVLSLFFALLLLENYGYGYWFISRPVVAGPIVGAVMGDIQTGMIVGGTVELMFLGILPIGGSIPPNAQITGIVSTAYAIMAGGDPAVGIALCIPISLLGQFMVMIVWNINIFLSNLGNKFIKTCETTKIQLTHLSGLVTFFIAYFIVIFAALWLGSEYVQQFYDALPVWLNEGLTAASKILPAVGMAMLIKMMDYKKYWAFLLLGYVLCAFGGLNTLAIALVGVSIVFGHLAMQKNKQGFFDFSDMEERECELSDKDLRRVFRRSFLSMSSINYERYMSQGFLYTMIPALKKFYANDNEALNQALVRNNEFFNCHPYTANAVMGVTLALEEERSKNVAITDESINSTKAALMGPLSGIGDSIFKATFMTIFAALGAGMLLDGNPLGILVFLVPNVLLNVFSRWYFIKYGYKFGTALIAKMGSSDLIEDFVQMATIVGLMVVAAMTISFVQVPIALEIPTSGDPIVVQQLLDAILPGLVPILITGVYVWILSKTQKGNYICLALSFAIGIGGVLLGII